MMDLEGQVSTNFSQKGVVMNTLVELDVIEELVLEVVNFVGLAPT
jgi:hypothetical protein